MVVDQTLKNQYTLDYILKNIMYDLVIDNTISYHGDIDYVSDHFTDGISAKLTISDNQSQDLAEFVKEYKEAKSNNKKLTIEQFYNL